VLPWDKKVTEGQFLEFWKKSPKFYKTGVLTLIANLSLVEEFIQCLGHGSLIMNNHCTHFKHQWNNDI